MKTRQGKSFGSPMNYKYLQYGEYTQKLYCR